MSRRHRRRPVSGRPLAAPGGHERIEEWPDGIWIVRSVTGSAATKSYRCPGCDHEIHPATPHLVAWPADAGGLDDRRHWHPACWRTRTRRGLRP